MIILDTHIWIWWVNDSPRLTEQHRQWIQDYQAQGLGISVISCWEVAKLVEKNRLVLSIPVEEWLQTALAYPDVQLVNKPDVHFLEKIERGHQIIAEMILLSC